MLPRKLKVLFLCTGNSCRSQMAEGFARALKSDAISAYSAGIEMHGLNPNAVKVMSEAGVDISYHASKTVEAVRMIPFDYVITVCGHANETCPTWLGNNAKVVNVGFDDPPALAKTAKTPEEAFNHYRRVRDQIADFIRTLPESLPAPAISKENAMGCCDGNKSDGSKSSCCTPAKDVRETVREGYSKIAETGLLTTITSPKGGGCCGGTPLSAEALAQQIGYSADEIKNLPEGANMGLSCGNPTAIANLKPGQVVLDLGSGGGFDVFLAGPKVGATGCAIGVDMTPAMLTKARNNITSYRHNTGLDNVEFRLGEIEHLPVADASVDVVISNCVINLSPDKPQVWREIARVLRPGGRVAASDMALLRPLPPEITQLMAAMVGCVAGAIMLVDYKAMMLAAGLTDVTLRAKPEYVAALSEFKDPLYRQISEALPAGTTVADYVTSVDVIAYKR